jgi:hypothetical protein
LEIFDNFDNIWCRVCIVGYISLLLKHKLWLYLNVIPKIIFTRTAKNQHSHNTVVVAIYSCVPDVFCLCCCLFQTPNSITISTMHKLGRMIPVWYRCTYGGRICGITIMLLNTIMPFLFFDAVDDEFNNEGSTKKNVKIEKCLTSPKTKTPLTNSMLIGLRYTQTHVPHLKLMNIIQLPCHLYGSTTSYETQTTLQFPTSISLLYITVSRTNLQYSFHNLHYSFQDQNPINTLYADRLTIYTKTRSTFDTE